MVRYIIVDFSPLRSSSTTFLYPILTRSRKRLSTCSLELVLAFIMKPRPTRPKDFLIISVSLRQEDRAPNAMMTCAALVMPRLSCGSEQTRDDSSTPAYGRTRGNVIRRGESLRYSSHGTAQYYYQDYHEQTLPSSSACCPEAPISYLPLPTF